MREMKRGAAFVASLAPRPSGKIMAAVASEKQCMEQPLREQVIPPDRWHSFSHLLYTSKNSSHGFCCISCLVGTSHPIYFADCL